MFAVRTDDLVKKFGSFTAVESLNLRIEQGEMYGLIGPNGSGKTTTIKMLCGLLKITSGSACLLGKKVPSKQIMQYIGYMPQDMAIYLDNTVFENLQLFGELYGLNKDQIAKREQELLGFVDLYDWRDELVSKLSGGMRHRASLACTLIHKPKLLFLDEPTVGVDPELRDTFWRSFDSLRKAGTTIVITTHYMDEANHCTKVGLLRRGKLIAEGSPEVLKTKTRKESLEDVFLTLARGEDK